jgi:hypothetical protein
MLESLIAAEAIAESDGAVTVVVVVSVVVASVEDVLPPQAVKKAATVKTSNNFFIVFIFLDFKIYTLIRLFKKGNPLKKFFSKLIWVTFPFCKY